MQLSIQGGDLTTTWTSFSYFKNTRASKSLAYGPGIIPDGAIGTPTEFVIQARNEDGENRKSGRDKFQVKITTISDEAPQLIPCEITDPDNGQYIVKYQVEEECEVKIEILFEDDKGKMVPLRGSPYKASFNPKSNPQANTLTGGAMSKYIQS